MISLLDRLLLTTARSGFQLMCANFR